MALVEGASCALAISRLLLIIAGYAAWFLMGCDSCSFPMVAVAIRKLAPILESLPVTFRRSVGREMHTAPRDGRKFTQSLQTCPSDPPVDAGPSHCGIKARWVAQWDTRRWVEVLASRPFDMGHVDPPPFPHSWDVAACTSLLSAGTSAIVGPGEADAQRENRHA